jgi:hypothetical protein
MTDGTKNQLSSFAASLLARSHISTFTGRDLLHDAFQAVLVGHHPGRYGRHPRRKDLANEAAFSHYLRGVIRSLVEGKTRRREHQHSHVPLQQGGAEDPGEHEVPMTLASPEDDLAFRDLKSEIFARLAARCPPRLQPMLQKWEQISAWSSKIPVEGYQRRDRLELRKLAKEVCAELGVDWRG